jgi:hypothetical protein
VLTRASQNTNTRLVDVVQVLTETGTLSGTGAATDRRQARRRPSRNTKLTDVAHTIVADRSALTAAQPR